MINESISFSKAKKAGRVAMVIYVLSGIAIVETCEPNIKRFINDLWQLSNLFILLESLSNNGKYSII
ncbi:hypothetical protein A9C19_09420 [Bacillus weihaiensis]|uniref:Uncharacterized protein n=1 Tax=Bacillus weihaiensis TaxID=1547283 RepID=A0A1L3MRK0_9BACI|nr:hypothetical protein A9C19_09420 [Bacillus weihaiensis]